MSHENLRKALYDMCLSDEMNESELDAIADAVMADDGRLAAMTARCGQIDGLRCRIAELNNQIEQAARENKRLVEICIAAHDRMLRGDDDAVLLDMLAEGWQGLLPLKPNARSHFPSGSEVK